MGFFNKNKEPKLHKAKTALQQGLPDKEYKRLDKILFDEKTPLTSDEQKRFAMAGLMLGKDEQKVNNFPVYDAKKTDLLSKQFASTYGELNVTTIKNTVDDILDNGFKSQFDEIYNVLTTNSEKEWSALSERNCNITFEQAEKLNILKQTFKYLSDYNMPMPVDTLSAYDIVRAANISAIAVGLDIISKEEAFELLNKCYEKAKNDYKTFDIFCSSYIFGRALWLVLNGKAMAVGNTRDINVCYMLLNSEKSENKNFEF